MDILVMKHISKSFFNTVVLKDVGLRIKAGEVHALLGENGAGKSTLMNILGGVLEADSGEIEWNGKKITNLTVNTSQEIGIAFVHQELNLFNNMTVYENIFLRKEIINKLGIVNKREMVKKCRELFLTMGVDINPESLVSELDTGKKQLLEISKALYAKASLIILDEPTTALNNNEVEHLFSIINRLKKEGKSFIFISHKMNEVFEIADTYTVLRNGEFIQSGIIKDVVPTQITKMIVGNSYVEGSTYQQRPLGEDIIKIRKCSGKGFSNINLNIRKGEIIGLTGLKGAGTSELMQAIFGIIPWNQGTMEIKGKVINKYNIRIAMKLGIGMVATNRKENSIFPDATLIENSFISEHVLSARKQYIHINRERNKYQRLSQMLNIRSNGCDELITALSGGNQQKVILARWLNTEADILLLDNPTQGIDIGAKAEIYHLILKLAEEGKTIIVNTLEINEIHEIADRCIVFFHGEVKKELLRSEISEENVMLYATNAIR